MGVFTTHFLYGAGVEYEYRYSWLGHELYVREIVVHFR